MIAREVTFHTVARHLLAQGVRSVDPGKRQLCLYRGPNGTKCAVGCLIPDAEYRPEFDVQFKNYLEMIFPQCPALQEHDFSLLGDLQYLHDNCPVGSWEQRLARFALSEGYAWPPPPVEAVQ